MRVPLMAVSGGLLLSWGVLLVVQSIQRFRRYLAAEGWPAVAGRVLSAYVARGVGEGEPEIGLQYEYEVAGVRYLSENIAPAGDALYTWIHPSVKLAQSLRRGDVVTVRYDPARPQHACLRPESLGALPLFVALGAFSVAFGALLVVWAR